MRSSLWAVIASVALVNPAHAAWVWVYGGEKHVLVPPEEGQPPWAEFADVDGDGRPDPVITRADLRIENERGEAIAKARVGQTIRLVAVPELGALELETLTVTFHLTGPGGEVEVQPDDAIRKPQILGTAPTVYTAQYTFPKEPVEELRGDYEARIEIELGGAKLAGESTQPAPLRVLGPRERTTGKVKRKVSGGVRKIGREVKDFGKGVAREVGEWLESQKRRDVPGALKDVQRRETRGMVNQAVKAPGSPLAAVEEALSPERAAALRSRKGPERSVLVVPIEIAQDLTPDGHYPLGYIVVGGIRLPSAADAEQTLPWACGESLRGARFVLEGQPGDPDGQVHFEGADGEPLVSLPAEVEWFRKLIWPGETDLNMKRQPAEEGDGLIVVKVLSAVVNGAARVEFTLPLVPAEPAGSGSPSPDE